MQTRLQIPIDVVFSSLLEELKLLIQKNKAGSRDAIARMLHHFPLLNKEAAEIVSQDSSYGAVIFYERVRLNMLTVATRKEPNNSSNSNNALSFCWEGLPTATSVSWDTPEARVFEKERCKTLTLSDVHAERKRQFLRINALTTSDDKVQTFLKLTGKLFYEARSVQRSVNFSQCWNSKCNRCFFASCVEIRDFFDPEHIPVELLDIPTCIPGDESGDYNHAYWTIVAKLPFYTDTLKRFCSSACCIQWKQNLTSFLSLGIEFEPDSKICNVAADGDGGKGGAGRIHRALQACIDRNFRLELLLLKRKWRVKCVSKRMARRELEMRIDALNIDTGVLYWASIVSQLPFYFDDATLPGSFNEWRFLPVNLKRVQSISTIYHHSTRTQNSQPKLLSSLHSPCRFLSSIKKQSMNLDRGLS